MSDSLVCGVDYVHLIAPPDRREDARWFYGSILGLREITGSQCVVTGSSPLGFALGEGCQLRITFEPVPRNSRATSHLALRVNSLTAVVENLKANGFEASVGSMSDGSGWRGFCNDPFGNRLEFVEYASAGPGIAT